MKHWGLDRTGVKREEEKKKKKTCSVQGGHSWPAEPPDIAARNPCCVGAPHSE